MWLVQVDMWHLQVDMWLVQCNSRLNAKFQQGTPTGKPPRTIKQNYHELGEENICSREYCVTVRGGTNNCIQPYGL